jgi:hypothetical protein
VGVQDLAMRYNYLDGRVTDETLPVEGLVDGEVILRSLMRGTLYLWDVGKTLR